MNSGSRSIKTVFMFCILALVLAGCTGKETLDPLQARIITPPVDQEIMEGETLFFQGEGSGGRPPYAFSWDFGVVAPSSSENNPGEIAFNYEGAYSVAFTVKDAAGNTKTDSVRIIVEHKYDVKPRI